MLSLLYNKITSACDGQEIGSRNDEFVEHQKDTMWKRNLCNISFTNTVNHYI